MDKIPTLIERLADVVTQSALYYFHNPNAKTDHETCVQTKQIVIDNEND